MGLFMLAAGGCASTGSDVDASQFDCPRGLARPFAVQTLIDAARTNDVTLRRDPGCGAIPDAVDAASNIVIGDDIQDDDEVEAREGHVICHIGDLPFAEPPFTVSRTKYDTDQETYLDVGNVSCAIYPTEAAQIGRLASALDALATAPVEKRSCPRGRPSPITVGVLIDAARSNGLRLRPDARCIAPGVVAQASTTVPYDPPEDADKIFFDQGDVTCLVRKTAAAGSKDVTVTELTVGKRFELRNVSCEAKPSYGDEAKQLGRVQATFDELAQRKG